MERAKRAPVFRGRIDHEPVGRAQALVFSFAPSVLRPWRPARIVRLFFVELYAMPTEFFRSWIYRKGHAGVVFFARSSGVCGGSAGHDSGILYPSSPQCMTPANPGQVPALPLADSRRRVTVPIAKSVIPDCKMP